MRAATAVRNHYAEVEAKPLMLEELGNALTRQGYRLSSSLLKLIEREFAGEFALARHPTISPCIAVCPAPLAEATLGKLIESHAEDSEPAALRQAIETIVADHYAHADAEPLMLQDVGSAVTEQGLRVSSGLSKFIKKVFAGEFALGVASQCGRSVAGRRSGSDRRRERPQRVQVRAADGLAVIIGA